MSGYRRIISYIYENKSVDKQEGRNIGFTKVEIRNGVCRLSVRMKLPIYIGEELFTLYLFQKGTGEEQDLVEIGHLRPIEENTFFRTVLREEDVEKSGIPFFRFSGLEICGTGRKCLCSCRWKEENWQQERLESLSGISQLAETSDSEIKVSEVPAQSADSDQFVDSDQPANQQSIMVEEVYSDRFSQIVSMTELHTYQKGLTKYIKIGPENLSVLPDQYEMLHSNSFLLHGFYNYKYLILGRVQEDQQKPQYIIGVPGTYRRNEKIMADMFGFSHYLETPEEEVQGYWCQKINL